jgi:hypothetical protein
MPPLSSNAREICFFRGELAFQLVNFTSQPTLFDLLFGVYTWEASFYLRNQMFIFPGTLTSSSPAVVLSLLVLAYHKWFPFYKPATGRWRPKGRRLTVQKIDHKPCSTGCPIIFERLAKRTF